MPTFTPAGKGLLVVLSLGALTGGYFWAKSNGYIERKDLKTVVPLKAELANEQVIAINQNVKAVAPPSSSRTNVPGPLMRGLVWEWNAMFGFLEAIGGGCTTQGSFMAAHNVNVCVERQDDTDQMKNELVAFATAMSQGQANPSTGHHFVIIMGDGAAQFLAAINPTLMKLGPEYQAEIVGAVGYSRGEDKFMGPAEWLSNPKAAMGHTVVGVIRDGDWNIAMKWAHDNEIPNNPNDKMHDNKALNWINASDYNDAAQKYVAGYCGDPVPVKGSPKTKVQPCAEGLVTWFPGDSTAAMGKGGLVSILSTKENAWQMPAVIIGIKKWFNNNRTTTDGLLAAAFEGADQVKTNSAAFQRAAEISAVVYHDKDAKYWADGFCGSGSMGSVACEGKGAAVPDKTGTPIEIGGSAVSNLADNLQMVNRGILKASYISFGDIVKQEYPSIVPSYPAYEQAFDPSFIMDVSRSAPAASNVVNAEHVTYSEAPITQTRGRAKWHINFVTGKYDIDPTSAATLQALYNDLIVNKFKIEVHGYTDNTGNPDSNITLSQERAQAVKQWLQDKSGVDFPNNRFAAIKGHGQNDPVASNATSDGKAQNRRVEIVIGTSR